MTDQKVTAPVRLSCARGLEYLLVAELAQWGIDAHEKLGSVVFEGTLADAYRCCLWSRLANRVVWVIAETTCNSVDELTACATEIEWEQHHPGDNATIAVDFHQRRSCVKHSGYGAQLIKDGVVDRLRDVHGSRPDVDRDSPALRINAELIHERLSIGLDLSLESLHRRGYRVSTGPAPLKETLAAAILARGGWEEIYAQGGHFLDPMCGSGTLLIEAALIAADVAPGLKRSRWGFDHWLKHDPDLWQSLVDDAESRARKGLSELRHCLVGSDSDPELITLCQQNLVSAGVAGFVQLRKQPVNRVRAPANTGLVATNPPYGERLDERSEADQTVAKLGAALSQGFSGWQAAIIVRDVEQGQQLGLRAHKTYKLFNGRLPCSLILLDLSQVRRAGGTDPDRVREIDYERLPVGAIDLANRLRKNLDRLAKWRRKEAISCFRAYDADLPEYSAAVDVYDGHLHVQEYAAPASIPKQTARDRLRALLLVCEDVFQVPRANIHLKTRQRQRGHAQYTTQGETRDAMVVREQDARFEVNLDDYLDTGLFLDSRGVRNWIAARVGGRTFLNLFCYTASASVRAALAGANRTVSVDTSRTYLEWGRRNMELNDLRSSDHELIRADAMRWLDNTAQAFDLILLDPPTFSNSKTTRADFKVQDDHAQLIRLAAKRLNPQGQMVFCTNYRRFEMDEGIRAEFAIREITQQTRSPDFARGHGHRAWLIERRSNR